MTKNKPPQRNALREAIVKAVDQLTIEDILCSLIADADLIEVACVLDFFAHKSNREVQVWHGPQREYPVNKCQPPSIR